MDWRTRNFLKVAKRIAMFSGLLGLVLANRVPVNAASIQFTYAGTFNASDALDLQNSVTPTHFAGLTPYTLVATFDTNSTNYVSSLPFSGFVAYSPASAALTIGSQSYSVDAFANNASGGITIALFDPSNIFFPGKYGAGFIQDAVQDGSGIVGDFDAASSAFSVNNIISTTFAGYNGAGFSSGPNMGSIARPITLRQGSQVFSLHIADRLEQTAQGSPLNTATLVAVPEPATFVLAAVSLVGLIGVCRRKAG